jgi:mRNA interferase MazF
MKRGDLYRVYKPADDSKNFRVFVIVSRQALIDSRFPTAVCARVYTRAEGLLTQIPVSIEEGCDDLASVRKAGLTHFIGSLSQPKLAELDRALAIAVGIR